MKQKKVDDKFRISTKIRYADDHEFQDYMFNSEIKANFIVDEVKKTTICTLEDSNVTRFFAAMICNDLVSIKEMQLCKKYGITDGEVFKVTVKTKCAPEDTFDRNEGMKIALEKAKMVRFAVIKEIVREFQNTVYRNFSSEMNMLENRVANIDKIVERRDKKRNKLMKKINFTVTREKLGDALKTEDSK